jgi:hypothetical protein
VALSWTGSSDSGGSGLAGYKIYRQKGSGANLPVGTVNSSTTAFTDSGPLEPNTAYNYTIVSFDNAQNHSSASNSVNPTTSSASDSTAPTVPTGFTGALTGRNSIVISWIGSIDTGGSGLKGYKVYRNDTLVSGSNPITATTFAQTGLSYSASYAYKVEAVDNANNASAKTSAVNLTTLTPIYFEDQFTRPNETTLGSPWGQTGPVNIGIAAGQAKVAADSSSRWATALYDAGRTDFTVTVNRTHEQSGAWSGIALFIHSDAGYRIVNEQGSSDISVYHCTDIKENGFNTCTEHQNSPISGAYDNVLSVRVLDPGTGDVEINGYSLQLDPSKIISGKVGITAQARPSGAATTFDNFIIEPN